MCLVEPVEPVERLGETRSRAREEPLVAELLEHAAAVCSELRGGGSIACELLHDVRLDRKEPAEEKTAAALRELHPRSGQQLACFVEAAQPRNGHRPRGAMPVIVAGS